MRIIHCDKCKAQIDGQVYSWMSLFVRINIGEQLPNFIPQYELCAPCNKEVVEKIVGAQMSGSADSEFNPYGARK